MTLTASLRSLCLILIISSGVTRVHAETASPMVRVEVEPTVVRVGESARMRVTVLVPTWQPQPPVFPSFEIPNAIVRLPADSSYPTTERVGRETWSGIIRNYRITPLVAARFELGGASIRITYADPGGPPVTRDVIVPAATLLADLPPGAESLNPYLSGTSFEITRTLDRDPAGLQIGDALVVRYEAALSGMPALFIPPLTPEVHTDLATAYASEPELTDGDPAIRAETITLVMEHGGTLVLPGASLDWWNQTTNSIETARLAPMTLSVAGPPPTSQPEDRTAARSLIPWTVWLLALLAAAVVVARWLPGLRRRLREVAARRRQTEPYRFRMLARMGARPVTEVYSVTLAWLPALDCRLDLRSFAERYGDEALMEDVEAMAGTLFADAERPVDVPRLLSGLTAARMRWIRQSESLHRSALAVLNP